MRVSPITILAKIVKVAQCHADLEERKKIKQQDFGLGNCMRIEIMNTPSSVVDSLSIKSSDHGLRHWQSGPPKILKRTHLKGIRSLYSLPEGLVALVWGNMGYLTRLGMWT